MGSFKERDLSEIIENSNGDAKEIIINCPKVTVNVEINNKKERRTYYDITEVFNDFEEGKVMGRIWRFGKEKSNV